MQPFRNRAQKSRQKLNLRGLCPVDDWSRDEYNDMSFENSEDISTVLVTMSENQNSPEIKIEALTQKRNSPQLNTSNDNYQDNQQQTWRGKSRG